MEEEEVREILKKVVKNVESYSQDCVVTLHVFPIEEGFICTFQFDLGDWKNIGYSGPAYIVDKVTSMYYMIPSGWTEDEINEYILKGRRSFLFRLRNKLINSFYEHTNY